MSGRSGSQAEARDVICIVEGVVLSATTKAPILSATPIVGGVGGRKEVLVGGMACGSTMIIM